MKELLRKAFEAGKDKQWDIEWQMGRSKPDFEQWYKEHEIQALNIPVVVGRSEQLKAFVSNFYEWHKKQNYLTVKQDDWIEYIESL